MHVRVGAAIALTTLAVVGCTGAPAGVDRVAPISPSLVMPAAALIGPAASGEWLPDTVRWEYSRNDAVLATTPIPPVREPAWVEIRTRDHQRTINGRPREFSTTWIRTNSLRVVR
jgi:hypothetical protein